MAVLPYSSNPLTLVSQISERESELERLRDGLQKKALKIQDYEETIPVMRQALEEMRNENADAIKEAARAKYQERMKQLEALKEEFGL